MSGIVVSSLQGTASPSVRQLPLHSYRRLSTRWSQTDTVALPSFHGAVHRYITTEH